MSADADKRVREEALEDRIRVLGQEISEGEEALSDLFRQSQCAQEDAYALAQQHDAVTPALMQQFGRHQEAFYEARDNGEKLIDRVREERANVQRELRTLRGEY